MSADAMRVAAATGAAPAAKRGRLSDRAWVDVDIAAGIARARGVTLRVHGVEVDGKLKQEVNESREKVVGYLQSASICVRNAKHINRGLHERHGSTQVRHESTRRTRTDTNRHEPTRTDTNNTSH